MQTYHAHLICGIVAHVKDRGVASVALRSLAIASECLTVRREQEEVVEIFEKIRKETGWKVGFIAKELKVKWGWQNEEAQKKMMAQQASASLMHLFPGSAQIPPAPTSLPPVPPPAPPPARTSMPQGILNPLLAKADFSLPNHPYQQYYQPPNHPTSQQSQQNQQQSNYQAQANHQDQVNRQNQANQQTQNLQNRQSQFSLAHNYL